MGRKMYEIGLMSKTPMCSDEEHDYETVEWECDYEKVSDARREAIRLSKKCPYKDYHGREIRAIQITCHSDEEDVSSYYLHWSELYENGRMVRRIDY